MSVKPDIARGGLKKEKLVKSKLLTSGYSMVPPGRFERPTPALGERCSIP